MKRPGIKLIIFDLYGVIVLGSYINTCNWLSKKYKIPYDKLWEIVYLKYFNMAAVGKITDQQAFALAIKELRIPIKSEILYKKHLSFLTLSKQSFQYAKSLQQRGYTVLLLSKNTPKQFSDIIKKTKVNRYFKHIINTYDLGLPKASRETMRYVYKKYKVKPSESIMIDDQKSNLVYPKKMGSYAVLYKSFKQMRRQVTKLLR